jgi:MoxR-like ATPase
MEQDLATIKKQLNSIILGKTHQIDLCLCCLLARGHLLIEDLPGMGKTILAHALANAMGLPFSRIQFTSDLLPADILGVSIFDAGNSSFRFHRGPIFSSVVLADEVNRASPKTQSALLEAMEERQVSIEGDVYNLPDSFFVIATQNSMDQAGTFPLPESQLDRFFMRIRLGYPDRASERQLLEGEDRRTRLAGMPAAIEEQKLLLWQQQVAGIKTSDALLDYVQDLVEQSRNARRYRVGLSPRAALDLVHGARAWALLQGRDYVIPEDVQTVLEPIAGHRLVSVAMEEGEVNVGSSAVSNLLELTPVR